MKNFHRTDVWSNVSVSAGADLLCLACGTGHSYKEKITTNEPVVIFITDQSFPPMLPSRMGNCPLIIRVEDGLLREMEGVFLDFLAEFVRPRGSLPVGSVVLVGSLSYLGIRGIHSYSEDLVKTIASICARVGQGVEVVPLVLVPIAGLGGAGLVWDVFDLDSWILGSGNVSGNILQDPGLHFGNCANLSWGGGMVKLAVVSVYCSYHVATKIQEEKIPLW